MGIFDALSRKSIEGEPVESAQWRTLGTQVTRSIDLFVVRPQSDSAQRFLKTIANLRSRFEGEVATTTQFESASSSLGASSAEFAIAQRSEIEALIADLNAAVGDTLEMFSHSIEAAGKPIGGMEQVRKGLLEAQSAPSLDEVRKHLASSITGLQKLVQEQAERERSLRHEFQEHSKKLSARLALATEEGRTDALTTLANRRAFDEHMDAVTSNGFTPNRPRSLALLDLDGFKPINDKFGHAAGDAALITFAGRLRKAVGDGFMVARLGGDEFAVDGEVSKSVLEALLDKLSNSCYAHPCFHEDRRMTIRFSYGVEQYDGSEDAASIQKKADAALYSFKQKQKSERAA